VKYKKNKREMAKKKNKRGAERWMSPSYVAF
jgi:hypothetical protein